MTNLSVRASLMITAGQEATEPGTDHHAGSKLGKEDVKAADSHPTY